MIEFKGSKKAFFKEYPKDRRSLDEIYCLVSYNIITKQETKTYYRFVETLSEKNFKKIEYQESKDTLVKQTESDDSHKSDTIAVLSKRIDDIIAENKLMSEEIAKLRGELNKKIDRIYKRLNAETWVLKSCINNHYDAIHAINKNLKVAKLEVYDNDERWFYMEK